jgi:hypothetical protein
MKVALCPPLHKFLFQLLVVILWGLVVLGRGYVLAMFSTKYANVFVMIFIFLLVSRKLACFCLHCRKQLHGLKSLAKGTSNGIGHTLMLSFPIKN